MLAHGCASYDRAVEEIKRSLLGPLTGDVIELGPGAGANLSFYDARVVRWTGVEPNLFAHVYLRERAAELGLDARLIEGVGESLPLESASADAVVSTLTLCTVHDVGATLAEVRRVLRPGGRFVFVEHVAAPRGTLARLVQRAVSPVWRVFADGCHPDRESWRAIEAAAFARTEITHVHIRVPVIGPHVFGSAVAPGDEDQR